MVERMAHHTKLLGKRITLERSNSLSVCPLPAPMPLRSEIAEVSGGATEERMVNPSEGVAGRLTLQ